MNNAVAFGGKAVNVSLPSGSKLQFTEPDQDGIVQFLGFKDVSDKKNMEPGSIIYLIGCDGKRNVSLSLSYQIREAMKLDSFVPGRFYYIHLADLVVTNPDFNKMKDFTIIDLGAEGDEVPVSGGRLADIKKITLSLETIKDLNYSKLNYPLRVV